MIDNDIAGELEQLAAAISRIRAPQNSNPHAFHEDRSELASRARSIAARLRSGPVAKPMPVLAPITARLPPGARILYTGEIVVDGRGIVVEERERCPAGVR